MELKQESKEDWEEFEESFNQTRMELKPEHQAGRSPK